MTRAPRLDLLITGLGRGGAETQVVRLSRALAHRGWSVRVLCLIHPTDFTDELAQVGVPLLSANMRTAWAAPRTLLWLVRQLRGDPPDLLVAFMFHADFLGRLAGCTAGVPVIVSSVRNIDMGGRHREFLLRLTSRLVAVTTANSAATARHLVGRKVAPEHRLHVIPNAVDPALFRRTGPSPYALRRELGASANDYVWLCTARFEPQKDHHTLFRAFARLQEQRADARLWLAGQGTLQEDLEALAEELGIAARTRFLGLKDVRKVLPAADAVVQSSAWEGLPNALLEAHAAGRPVVATDVGGTAEIVREGESGYLVPRGDHQALADAMLRMMDLTPGRRLVMGEAGSQHVMACYNLDRIVGEWLELFDRLLAPGGA